MTGDREVVTSADNVLLLVVALRERGRLRVTDAARLLSVTPSTAHRLLTALKRQQFAEQDRSRVYLPGPRLEEWNQNVTRAPDLSILARPHLADLSETTGETVHLVTLEGNGCRFIDGVDSPRALRVGSRVGLLLPAHITSGGKVMLAQLPDPDLAALYPTRQVQMRDGTARTLISLRRELTSVRQSGFALNLEASEQGVNAIGVPVLSASSGRVLAALVVAAPASRSGRRLLVDHLDLLRDHARRISTALPEVTPGGEGPPTLGSGTSA